MNKRTTARRKAAARPAVDPERHERLCTVCSHPEREAIEEAFIHWRSLADPDGELDLPSDDSICRHAHALGLFEQRSRNMRFALENIIESSERVQPTADSIIRAIRACSCLKDNGEWIDPPTTHRVIVNVTRGDTHPPIPLLSLPNDGSEAPELSAALSDLENGQENELVAAPSTRTSGKIENAATH
jgi:hypothetical protein